MCGIAGVFGVKDPETVARMLRVMAHRGPDDQHVVYGEGYTLGARRLSIIDLDNGRQPLSEDQKRIWAAQNGEIYNFREAREELLKNTTGHVFFTDGDTEVIPHLYREFGLDFPTKLEGMFAISIFDEIEQQGVLARDRSGKKPLYYLEHQGALWYASEVKALLQVPGFQRNLNLEAVHHYLSYKNVPTPLSIFEGIRMLKPAHRLLWKNGQIRSVEPYWRLDWTPFEGKLDEQELAEEFIRRMKAGVKRRLVSDVPIGFFLSGGIDSSLSTALAAEVAPDQIKTFTLTYSEESSTPGKELDLRCAREIAKRYDTDHHEEQMNYGDFQRELPAILSHFDEPFSGVVSTYFLSRLISKHVKVAISGDGSDELFGSYLTHRMARPAAELCRARAEGREPGDLGHFSEGQPREFLGRIAEPQDWVWKHKLAVFTDADKQSLYSSEAAGNFSKFSTQAHLKSIMSDLTAGDPTNRILETEFLTQLPDQVLAFTDRLSMAHSLEIRTAFLDTQVMEFVARIPERFKIRDRDVKVALKTAARPYLPASAIDRPKEGFVLPVNQWLQGWLFSYAKEALSPSELKRHDLFSAKEVTSLLNRFEGGDAGLANKILSLLSFQIWYDIYMAQSLPVPLGDAAKLIVEQSGGEKKLVDYTIASVKVPGVANSEALAGSA
ncbi:MAG TPA: asparagine synthase (glutamine-hydrolyzing) [Phycisphaerales bacterium]|nr:asparagine synthase (glutamine-hydrolyzing) [Phycisphaerales bacterium]